MRRTLKFLLAVLAGIIIIFGCDSSGSGTLNPTIKDIQPESGPPGTGVTITGSDFSPTPSENNVTFDGTSAPVTGATETEIETEVPEEIETGEAEIEVSVDGNTAAGPSFTVEMEAPGISSVEPDSGTVGTEVTIQGMNFSSSAAENTITFAGTDAPVNGAATDQLVTEVPQGATKGPIEVTVNGKTATGPDFDVIITGTLTVNLSTTGDDKDTHYELTVDGIVQNAAANETVTFDELDEGNYQVELSDVANNCDLNDENPKFISINPGESTSISFNVTCKQVAHNKIVFHSNRDGDYEIYMMNPDGSNLTKLTDNFSTDKYPVFSNDATQISFVSDRNGVTSLLVMDVDGTNIRTITSASLEYTLPISSWSPDDSQIVFGRTYDMYKINSDGSGESLLVEGDEPNWSPDGNKIAYTDNYELHTINTDGSNKTLLAGYENNNPDSTYLPRWSPNGNKLAASLLQDGYEDIYTINSDGSGFQRITNMDQSDQRFPTWSPDASELVIQSGEFNDHEIVKLSADGSSYPDYLTRNDSDDGAPHWSPVE